MKGKKTHKLMIILL